VSSNLTPSALLPSVLIFDFQEKTRNKNRA